MRRKKQKMQVLVLAAGQGTRMKSSLPKVLHHVAGYPMIHHIIETIAQLNPSKIGVVVRPEHREVQHYLQSHFPHLPLFFFEQDVAQGTGHAVQCAQEFYQGEERTLILCGDTPLIQKDILKKLCAIQKESLALMVMKSSAPRGYGQCQMDDTGHVIRIVESKEPCSAPLSPFYNAGVYWIENSVLRRFLPCLVPSQVTQELYLTDLIHLGYQEKIWTCWVEGEEEQFLGINSRADLADAERVLQTKLRLKAMARGCTLIDPETVYFAKDTLVEEDVWIGPSVFFGPGVTVGKGARIVGFCVFQDAVIGAHTQVGPFVHLRPGSILHEHVKVGNFVEIKNATLHAHVKANHLSYLGDATIGTRTNIGAGTITCNYDGISKNITTIENDVMIGSNTALIAPVHIGAGAYVGAGSVITQDVPPQDLAIARGRQRNIPQGAEAFRAHKKPSYHPSQKFSEMSSTIQPSRTSKS